MLIVYRSALCSSVALSLGVCGIDMVSEWGVVSSCCSIVDPRVIHLFRRAMMRIRLVVYFAVRFSFQSHEQPCRVSSDVADPSLRTVSGRRWIRG